MKKEYASRMMALFLAVGMSVTVFADDLNKASDTNTTSEHVSTSETNGVKEEVKEEKVLSEVDKFLSSTNTIVRLSGDDRIQTSIEISKFQNSTSDKVIIVDARSYPDALSASNLTEGKYPVLLVGPILRQSTIDEIVRLKASEVLVLGGENSVSKTVENQLSNVAGISSVKRLAGIDRFDTSAKAFEEDKKKSVVLASGKTFPDALTASFLTKDSGLLLTAKDNMPNSIKRVLRSVSDKNIKIVGGEGSISDILVKRIMSSEGITNFMRLSGKNRYETSVNIANRSNSDTLILASGKSFPDALAASTLSQKIDAPIVLLDRDRIDSSVLDYFKNRGVRKAIILGGENTISSKNQDNVDRLMRGLDIEDINVSKETIGENNVSQNDKNGSGARENISTESIEAPKFVGENIVKDSKLKGYQYLDGRYVDNSIDYSVTTQDVNMYSNESLEDGYIVVPKNKIVDVLEKKDSSTKIRYNGYYGYVDKDLLKKYDPVSFGKVVNNVPYISQLYPVYAPNGCEPTSMLMGLKGKGYTNIGLRAYLDKVPKTNSNPRWGYVGVPYNVEEGRFQTIDPQPLAKYGRTYGKVENIQGADINKIIREIQNGNTVVAYETLYWNNAYYRTLYVEGVPMRRIWNNHVVLLTGYDPVKKSFYVADPYNHEKAGGNRKSKFYYWKSKDVVDRCYNYDNRRFAVVIR